MKVIPIKVKERNKWLSGSKCRKIKSRENFVLKASHWSVMTSFLENGGDEYIDDNDESDNSYDNTSDDDEDN